MSETPFEFKCSILSEIWMEYRDDEEFLDFIEYNDLGLPLAYAFDNGIIEDSPMARQFVDESYRVLLSGLDIEGDPGFETLDDVFDYVNNVNAKEQDEGVRELFPPEGFRDKSNGE